MYCSSRSVFTFRNVSITFITRKTSSRLRKFLLTFPNVNIQEYFHKSYYQWFLKDYSGLRQLILVRIACRVALQCPLARWVHIYILPYSECYKDCHLQFFPSPEKFWKRSNSMFKKKSRIHNKYLCKRLSP